MIFSVMWDCCAEARVAHTDRKNGEQNRCEINFLTGKGIVSKGVSGKARPLRQHFRPVKLAAWSARAVPQACR
jgi:hypothetical protein